MKKILKIAAITALLPLLNGCSDNKEENLQIVTTSYPIEYVTNILYGEYSMITSIYPDSIEIENHELTDKQLTNYSNSDLFIYNGLSNEKDTTIQLLEKNPNLNIIDSAYVLEIENGIEELWLNPSNLLMMGQNIKIGLNEYIDSSFLKQEINDNYEELKVTLSELDAEIKLMAQTAKNKTLIVANDSLKYLEKYGLTVISLEENQELLTKDINLVKTLYGNNELTYMFMIEDTTISNEIQTIIDENNITILPINKLDNLSEEERDNNENYITLMNKNIEQLKKELYQ